MFLMETFSMEKAMLHLHAKGPVKCDKQDARWDAYRRILPYRLVTLDACFERMAGVMISVSAVTDEEILFRVVHKPTCKLFRLRLLRDGSDTIHVVDTTCVAAKDKWWV